MPRRTINTIKGLKNNGLHPRRASHYCFVYIYNKVQAK